MITVTLKEDPETTDTYTVSTVLGEDSATIMINKYPVPELTIASASVTPNVDEGGTVNIRVRANTNPIRRLTFKYTPTETGTEYLLPIDENGVTKGSGDERTVTLPFAQEGSNPSSEDPWFATIELMTQADEDLGGTISVVLVDGVGYTVGDAKTSTITVNDLSLPILEIAYVETDTVVGRAAMFEVISKNAFTGPLDVTYNPVKDGGDYLDESDGDGTALDSGPNTNSGLDRTVRLVFVKDGDDYKAPLMVATINDESDTDGGTIAVTLQEDPAVTDTYKLSTVPSEILATAMVIKAPIPELTIFSTSTEVDVNEGAMAEINIMADMNPKQPVKFSYTPTETGTTYLAPITADDGTTMLGSGTSREVELVFSQADSSPGSTDPWITTLRFMTQEAVALNGTITVVLDAPGADDKYTVGKPDTAIVTVDDISIPELSITDALKTVAGSDAKFIVTSNIPFVDDVVVEYNPVKAGGNYLNETDTDGTSGGLNTNSGLDRTDTISFEKVGDDYIATLSVATVDDRLRYN